MATKTKPVKNNLTDEGKKEILLKVEAHQAKLAEARAEKDQASKLLAETTLRIAHLKEARRKASRDFNADELQTAMMHKELYTEDVEFWTNQIQVLERHQLNGDSHIADEIVKTLPDYKSLKGVETFISLPYRPDSHSGDLDKAQLIVVQPAPTQHDIGGSLTSDIELYWRHPAWVAELDYRKLAMWLEDEHRILFSSVQKLGTSTIENGREDRYKLANATCFPTDTLPVIQNVTDYSASAWAQSAGRSIIRHSNKGYLHRLPEADMVMGYGLTGNSSNNFENVVRLKEWSGVITSNRIEGNTRRVAVAFEAHYGRHQSVRDLTNNHVMAVAYDYLNSLVGRGVNGLGRVQSVQRTSPKTAANTPRSIAIAATVVFASTPAD